MPYDVWLAKLERRVDTWYKKLEECSYDTELAAAELGIDSHYWSVCGSRRNILSEKQFDELTFYQKVWVVKSLCDHCMVSH